MTRDWAMLKRRLRQDVDAMRIGLMYQRATGLPDGVRSGGAWLRESARRSIRADVREWRRIERALELALGMVDLGEAGE